jgi:hypothetical protein
MTSYPDFDEFQKKQEEILEELERVRELSLLHDIGQSMHTLNLEETLELILQGVAKGIGFDRVRLYLLEEEKRQLFCKMTVGMEKEKIQSLTSPMTGRITWSPGHDGTTAFIGGCRLRPGSTRN